ncbi:MAG: ABC transporter ATP-binding protein, partial [Bacillales bacterium]
LKQNDLAKFRRRHLGFVFQDFNLLKTLTVEENIVLSMTLDNRPVKEMKQRVEEIAETLGIKHILKKRINEISGGQMQRAAVARAIIHEPKLLLADEPTGNLDSKSSKDVMELFTLVNESFNTTILLVTHDPTAASYCDRVLFIRDGKLYSEIHKGDNRHVFFQKIIDTISLMGGNGDDLSAVRLP